MLLDTSIDDSCIFNYTYLLYIFSIAIFEFVFGINVGRNNSKEYDYGQVYYKQEEVYCDMCDN